MIKALTLFLFLLLPSICFANADFGTKIADAAAKQIGTTISYDPSYTKIKYPNGDVDIHTGVCADVIIRAYREQGIDLQKLVHDDMKKNFGLYPKIWGLKSTDTNIDHRRVPNLRVFFKRHGKELPKDKDFQTGDIVTWNLSKTGSIPHIGIVSTLKAKDGTPLMIHNIGYGTRVEYMLFDYEITGHYRYEK